MTAREQRSTLPMVIPQKTIAAKNNTQRIFQISTAFMFLAAVFYTGLSLFQAA